MGLELELALKVRIASGLMVHECHVRVVPSAQNAFS